MKNILVGLAICLALEGVVSPLQSQSVFNPDISVIPRFLFSSDDGGQLPDRRVFSRPEFTLEEMELGLQAYVNPYARGDIFLSFAGIDQPEFGIEEAYVTFLKGLPLDMNVRLGKYRAEFGKLNMLHPHARPFVGNPLMQERFLGEEGLNDLGVSVSFLIPTGDLYTRLSVDMLSGRSIAVLDPGMEAGGGGPGLVDTTGGARSWAQAGRAMTFVPLSENSDMEIGLSALTGIHDPYGKLRFWYWNIDFKYKWKPSDFTSLTVWGEGILNTRRVDDGLGGTQAVKSSGLFVFADYQFLKTFSVGARVDWSASPYRADDRASAVAVFAGYYPVEESLAFRLQYERTRYLPAGAASSTVNALALQVMFSLGPHRAHTF
jgi:hypothetical protein